jgi:hypothetical protein
MHQKTYKRNNDAKYAVRAIETLEIQFDQDANWIQMALTQRG